MKSSEGEKSGNEGRRGELKGQSHMGQKERASRCEQNRN